ncbi:MAG: zinc ribbon domain-containing protein, partial [Candidatus Woesearchaeota archaeon]|nr:zinc ribbon domain-containing protein [Candidatus Woesearchaeota archaeon]
LDASWGKLRQYIAYKAGSAGKLYVSVDHRGTTQMCSRCGIEVKKELWDRTHKCVCGFIVPRDYNSALEIKKRLIKQIGWEPSEYKLVEIPLTTELLQGRSTSYVSVKQEATSL